MQICVDALASKARLMKSPAGNQGRVSRGGNTSRTLRDDQKGLPGQGNSMCTAMVMGKDMRPLRNLEIFTHT